MKKNFVFIIAILILMFVSLGNTGINGAQINEKEISKLKKEYPNDEVLIMHIVQTTGPSWEIVNSPNNVKDELIVLNYPFDPKLLRINKDWDFIGLQVKFVVIADKKYETIKYPGTNESFRLITAKKIYIDEISYTADIGNLKLKDLMVSGIVKSFVGLFIPSVRYSY